MLEAFHVLNQFDIPKGAAREEKKDEHGNVHADYTIWTAASDPRAKRFYFRTYENSQIRMVDLMKMNLDGKDIVTISMKGEEVVKSVDPVTGHRKVRGCGLSVDRLPMLRAQAGVPVPQEQFGMAS